MNKIEEIMLGIDELNLSVLEEAQKRLDNLTKPKGSLGILEEIVKKVVSIKGKADVKIEKKAIFTLAGDHGITEEKISLYPKDVTAQMVYNFLRGGAGINVLARLINAKVVVADMGVASELKSCPGLISKKIAFGTKNMLKEDAMTRQEAEACVEAGIAIFEDEFEKGLDVIGTGDMGIGNTTSSTAIAACFLGEPVERLTGRGTGIDDGMLYNKINVINEVLKKRKPDSSDAIDVLSKVGGFEIGGLAGIILTAARNKIPVVLDGFISGAAALIAQGLEPVVKNYLIASHNSVEQGHKRILEYLGLEPLFDLKMRLGEGTGACFGIFLVEAAIRTYNEMASFEEAKVSRSIEEKE